MTRINVISVKELSDQWLLAEYRELPRIIKTENINVVNAPENYILGKGHVKWAITHSLYCLYRYYYICKEMKQRGFIVNFPYDNLAKLAEDKQISLYSKSYIPTQRDINLNRNRLIEKYKQKSDFYKWTKRNKPSWLHM